MLPVMAPTPKPRGIAPRDATGVLETGATSLGSVRNRIASGGRSFVE
jgi:hypothetical protein